MKEDMKCKSFDWFMTEIAYDVLEKYPKMPPNLRWGELRNQAGGKCLDTFGRHPPEKAGASGCHGFGGNQLFMVRNYTVSMGFFLQTKREKSKKKPQC